MITTEVLLALIGLLGSVLTGAAYIGKRRADARLKEADARVKSIEVELTDAVTKRQQSQAVSEQSAHLMDMFEKQIAINQQNAQQADRWMSALREKESRDEANYNVLKRALDAHTGYLGGLVEANFKAVSIEMKASHQQTIAAIDAIPNKVTTPLADFIHEFAEKIATSVGAAVALQLSNRDIGNRPLYPFPDASEPNWREVWITPVNEHVALWRTWRLGDDTISSDLRAVLDAGGEKALINESVIERFIAVRRSNGYYGWVLADKVRIKELEQNPAGGETQPGDRSVVVAGDLSPVASL